MFILDPGSEDSNKKGWKIVVLPFFVAINFRKLKIIYFLNDEVKNSGQFSKNYRTFYPKKIVTKLSKIWVWDTGSKIQDP